jgi:hypothetical protein
MAKRFTDSDKWDDPWYRKLPILYKSFWEYVCCRCDYAGIWKVDIETAIYYIGDQVDEKTALELFNTGKERIKVINHGSKWFVVDFINFQYGHLSTNHLSNKIRDMLIKEGLTKGIDTLREGFKINDNDKININNNIDKIDPETGVRNSTWEAGVKRSPYKRI